jgi:nucleoside phosphorylase
MMGPSPGPPLLIVCALRVESFALRRRAAPATGTPEAAGPAVRVLRTGMGPQAAERAVTDALRDPALRGATVLTTGFCAGLATGMRPGDVVVAEPSGPFDPTAPAAPDYQPDDPRYEAYDPGEAPAALAAALKEAGHTVHLGPLAQSDHVVRGAERAALRATGAIAVDMESVAMRRAALAHGAGTVAAARVVVDTPEHELVRIGTLRTGVTAFRVLRDLTPAFVDWHRSNTLSWR